MKVLGQVAVFTLLIFMDVQWVFAEMDQAVEFEIPAQRLPSALLQFSESSGIKIFFNADIGRNIETKGLSGQYTPQQALDQLLQNTGITYRLTETGSVTLSNDKGGLSTEMLLAMTPGEPLLADAGEGTESTGPVEQEDLTVSGREWSGYTAINATSGTKTDTPMMETPLNVQVIPPLLLQDQQVIQLDQALKNVSGVTTSKDIFGTNSLFLRGFPTQALFRNGVRFADNGFGDAQQFANVERIEVLNPSLPFNPK